MGYSVIIKKHSLKIKKGKKEEEEKKGNSY